MPSQGFIITLLLMTISRMAAGDQDAVYALLECFKDKLGFGFKTPLTQFLSSLYMFIFLTPVK